MHLFKVKGHTHGGGASSRCALLAIFGCMWVTELQPMKEVLYTFSAPYHTYVADYCGGGNFCKSGKNHSGGNIISRFYFCVNDNSNKCPLTHCSNRYGTRCVLGLILSSRPCMVQLSEITTRLAGLLQQLHVHLGRGTYMYFHCLKQEHLKSHQLTQTVLI